mmetsp:Transcript_6136/g.8312  ORF Transcript_6136/g.8312 Transcript_6136/m.8312 type:complete len:219 (-) Transcript_6136:8-664(-)
MRVSAALRLSCRNSVRIANNQIAGLLGFFNRPCSKSARALVTFPATSSAFAAAVQRGTQSAHFLNPKVYASRAPAKLPCLASSCPSISHIFHDRGYLDSPSLSSSFSFTVLPSSRSTIAPFIHMRIVPPFSRALARIMRARSGSWFSNSNLNAASQTSSESGLAAKASCRMARAPGMSPASHFSFAPISHRISAWGQYVTALRSSVSSDSVVPCAFSN